MPGMNSGINISDPTVVAAFKAALLHQGLIALLIFAVLGLAWVTVRAWLPAAARNGTGAATAGTHGQDMAEPAWRQLLRIGFGLIWVFDGILQAQPKMAVGLPSQVIEPIAASSPKWVQHVVNWAGTSWSYHPMQAGASAVWIQVGVGIWMLAAARGTLSRLAGLVERAGLRLFARNIRGFLGPTEINKEIEATLKTKPEYFWYYNNGITIVCDQAEEIRSQGRQILRVRNPQIINGQQTSRTLHRHGGQASSASTLVKVIRVPRESDSDSDHFDSLVSDIVQATNWQNKISPSDLRSNDRRQIALERELRKLGYWYIRKRQTKSEAKRMALSKRYIMLRKEELAQAVAGCDLDPGIPRTQKEGLFEDRFYSTVFASKDPWYYLTRYRLLREVNAHARGSRDWGNAKWLVLHVVWSKVSPAVRSRAAAELFVTATHRHDFIVVLSRAINTVFDAVKQFYRANKKKTAKTGNQEGDGQAQAAWHHKEAVDVPTFFKRRGLHTEFASFWRGSEAQKRFERTMEKFVVSVKQELVS